ncbi:MAG TPA: HAD family hydrolase [Patescibacteria group bacterium]|jgi:pyrophosphatase PpaX|nr:HAD family hydrolase [Patescibacteria group bacterium]
MKTYQYILLDWDGNLAKTLDIWLDAFRSVLEVRGFHKSDEEIAATFGGFTRIVSGWGIDDVDVAMDEADRLAKQKLPQVALYPDALEVLQSLHLSGKELALITSSSHENVQHLLHAHNIADLFKVVIASDDIVNHKPHPEALQKALDQLGGTKDQAIMIGDSDKDLGAAKNMGIDSILFYPAEHKKFYDFEKLKELRPTYVVEDFRKVVEIVG